MSAQTLTRSMTSPIVPVAGDVIAEWDYAAGYLAAAHAAVQLRAKSATGSVPAPALPFSPVVDTVMAQLGITGTREDVYESMLRRGAFAFAPDNASEFLTNPHWARGWIAAATEAFNANN